MLVTPIFNFMKKGALLAMSGLLVTSFAEARPGHNAGTAAYESMMLQDNTPSSEQINVIGNIADENGEPLPGATVILKGNKDVHAIADIDGNYSITVPDRWAVLTFSSLGFISQDIQVGNRRVVNVTMVEDIGQLQDAVVVAYGQQKKESVVASITAIEPGKLKTGTTRSLSNNLAGTVAGVLGCGSYLLGPEILRIYTEEEKVIRCGMEILSITTVPYFLCGIMDLFPGALRGMGYSAVPMILSIIGTVGMRVVWIFGIFPHYRSLYVLFISYPGSWLFTIIMQVICFYFVRKKIHQM